MKCFSFFFVLQFFFVVVGTCLMQNDPLLLLIIMYLSFWIYSTTMTTTIQKTMRLFALSWKKCLSLSSFNGWSVVLNWMTIFLCTILLLFAAFLCVCANKTFKIEFLLFNKIGFQAVYMQMQSVRKMQMIAT